MDSNNKDISLRMFQLHNNKFNADYKYTLKSFSLCNTPIPYFKIWKHKQRLNMSSYQGQVLNNANISIICFGRHKVMFLPDCAPSVLAVRHVGCVMNDCRKNQAERGSAQSMCVRSGSRPSESTGLAPQRARSSRGCSAWEVNTLPPHTNNTWQWSYTIMMCQAISFSMMSPGLGGLLYNN